MKKFLALYVIAIVSLAVGITSAKAGTIAHWTFENDGAIGSTPTTFTDVVGGLVGTTDFTNVVSPLNNTTSPAGNTPTIVGDAPSGFGNKGLSFDGVDDTVYVASGSSGPLALSGDFTIEIGMQASQTSGIGFGVFYGDAEGGLDPYYIYVDGSGGVLFQIYPGGGSTQSNSVSAAAGTVVNGASTQIAAVFDFDDDDGTITDGVTGDDNMLRLFVDQTEIASANIGTNQPFYGDTISDFWMGSIHSSGGGHFDGLMTDVRISDMALAPEDMLLVPEPGIVAIFGIGLLGLGIARRKRS